MYDWMKPYIVGIALGVLVLNVVYLNVLYWEWRGERE